jgi:hypothetical protein
VVGDRNEDAESRRLLYSDSGLMHAVRPIAQDGRVDAMDVRRVKSVSSGAVLGPATPLQQSHACSLSVSAGHG